MRSLILYSFLLLQGVALAQFPPGVGQPGTTAMHADSAAFTGWASNCTVTLGYINFVDTTVVFASSNKPQYGTPASAIDTADNNVISIGDRGVATLTFSGQLYDGVGPDFAIFENAFSDEFLELAYVEVSSDGEHFVRFPGVSLTQTNTQVATYGTLDPTKIHNFGGKYRSMYGTPFDLSDLADSSGVDLQMITHIRIIDVGGCILEGYQSFDSQGNIINDPWPTPFFTGGFDLDAVGLIHLKNVGIDDLESSLPFRIFPNPVIQTLNIIQNFPEPIQFTLYDLYGKEIVSFTLNQSGTYDLGFVESGFYLLSGKTEKGLTLVRRIIKQ